MSRKSVLITGCSAGGIGHALAKAFQQRDLHVFATARSTAKMADLATLPNVTLLTLDVTSEADLAAAVQAVEKATGGSLDYLVNNSGQQYMMPGLDVDIEAAKRLYDVNFWGVLRTMQAFAPLLIAAKGMVVNIGSISAYSNNPFMSMYVSSKAALHSLDEAMREELAPLGVKLLTVVAGVVGNTALLANSPPLKLPPASRYLALEDELAGRARGGAAKGFTAMAPEVFAAQVVDDALKGAGGKVHRGSYASVSRVMSTLLPRSTIVNMVNQGLDMGKLKPEAG